MVCPWYINIIGTEPTCLILASATPSYNPCVLPGDNSTHSNFQATAATSRLQKQLWIACMCARAHTHTQCSINTQKQNRLSTISLSHTYAPTHPRTHSSINAQTQNPLFPLSLTHTYNYIHKCSLFFSHTYIYIHTEMPPPPPQPHMQTDSLSLSLSLMYTLT